MPPKKDSQEARKGVGSTNNGSSGRKRKNNQSSTEEDIMDVKRRVMGNLEAKNTLTNHNVVFGTTAFTESTPSWKDALAVRDPEFDFSLIFLDNRSIVSSSAKKSKKNKRADKVEFVENEFGLINQVPMNLKVQLEGPDPPTIRPRKEGAVNGLDAALVATGKATSFELSTTDQLAHKILDAREIRHRQTEEKSKNKEAIETNGRYTGTMYRKDLRAPNPDKQAASRRTTGLKTHLDPTQAPVHDLSSIFDIIAHKLDGLKFSEACEAFSSRPVRIVTMCSGTESPLLAINMLNGALARRGQAELPIDHLASAEIEPFKQAYIQRNFQPKVLFRDVTEFIDQHEYAHTAFGGLAAQPDEVHLLIAGSSCIDYSSLNIAKKEWAQSGQSYKTMDGVFQYAKRYRPAIVILENVEGAPWHKIVDNMWSQGGYFCMTFYLDSKDFYIPQTRNRGYMIGFDKDRADRIGLNLFEATETIVSALKCLSQRASSPYTDFIFGGDDPELKVARRELARNMEPPSNMDWAKCRIRYAGYRIQHQLGNARPLTFWKNGGRCQFSDYAWMEWARGQRERIWDTLDINFLAYAAERHYDMRYKSRFVELSQNVDRDQDSRHWGIVGCITPSGMPWDTRRGGPVFGREALALQGIPAKALSLNLETSKQLQNLAGNAMTTTVIGSVIFSAILGGNLPAKAQSLHGRVCRVSMFEDFESFSKNKPARNSLALTHHKVDPIDEGFLNTLEAGLLLNQFEQLELPPTTSSVSVRDLEKLAEASTTLCNCDDVQSEVKQFYKCKLCGHTACSRCAGNPKHKYQELGNFGQSTAEKHRDFVDAVSTVLPPLLSIHLSSDAKEKVLSALSNARCFNDHDHEEDCLTPGPLDVDDFERYRTAVFDALTGIVYFQSIKRGSLQRAIYKSSKARVELQFSRVGQPGQSRTICTWLIFAQASGNEPAMSIVRDLLRYPVARMQPSDDNILQGSWEIWDPSMPYVYVDIHGIGSPQPSWEQKLGLQQNGFQNLKVWPRLKIQPSEVNDEELDARTTKLLYSLSGHYELLSDYESACGSLHRRIDYDKDKNQAPFLFLEPKPLQDAYQDRMVFAQTHVRYPQGVNRPVTAEVIKAWRPNSLFFSDDSCVAKQVPCRLIDVWLPDIEIVLSSSMDRQDLTLWVPRTIQFDVENCTSTVPLLVSHLRIDRIPQSQWLEGVQYRFPLIDRPGAMKEFQWQLKPFMQHWPRILREGSVELQDCRYSCLQCAPRPPAINWCYTRKHPKNSKQKTQLVIRPFEDPNASAEYETKLNSRPIPMEAQVVVQHLKALLVVKFNLSTTIHRLHSRLDFGSATGEVKWRILHKAGPEATPPFPKLTISKEDSGEAWPTGDDHYHNQLDVTKPKSFKKELWPTQLKALAWMRQLEGGIRWQEWDAEIYDAPALDLQIRVEATKQVEAHGGIVADEVGAGKTATSLALIARGLEDLPPRPKIPQSPHTKRIRSRATLVLVPNNIISQWNGEIDSFFKRKPDVLVLSKNNTHNQYNVQQMTDADIIIAPWQLFNQDGVNNYWTSLSRVCGAPNIPKAGGRAFSQWLSAVVVDIEHIVKECGPGIDVDKFDHDRERYANEKMEKYMSFSAFHKSDTGDKSKLEAVKNRKTGIYTPDALTDNNVEEKSNAKEVFEEWYKRDKKMDINALLHFFCFERLIVDEFTYLDARELAAIQTIEAKFRWLLSGTPPITNSESIESMAALIGTRISSKTGTNEHFSFKNARIVKTEEKTYAEDFRDRLQVNSPAWITCRNERSVAFVRNFIRQNPAPAAEIHKHEQYIVIPPSALEVYLYNKTFQTIANEFVRFGVKATIKIEDSIEAMFRKTVGQAETPEEALLSCHANLIRYYLNRVTISSESDDDTSSESNGDLVICRQLEAEALDSVIDNFDRILVWLQEAYYYWLLGQANVDNGETNDHLVTYLHSIWTRSCGDPSAADLLSFAAAYARQNTQRPAERIGPRTAEPYNDEARHNIQTRRSELQKRATLLNTQSLKLVEQVRQLRHCQAVAAVISEQDDVGCDVCGATVNLEELTLLGRCGHLVCRPCLTVSSASSTWDPDKCPSNGCSASSNHCQTPAKRYIDTIASSTSQFGTKIDAVIDKINSIDAAERVLIFIQFLVHRDQLIQALKEQEITYADGTRNSARTIAAFQDEKRNAKRVLILQIDSADAAGWNLHTANHVMFVTPFLAKTQYDYDSTMTQAVGRAFRHRQKRNVIVYHFLTAMTLDVNVLQERSGKKLVKKQDGEYGLVDSSDELAEAQNDLSGPSLDFDAIKKAGDEDGDGDDDDTADGGDVGEGDV